MKKSLLTIALLSVAAINVNAGEAEIASFNQIDTDQDGVITVTESEINKALAAHFSELDTNVDGQLTLAEFEKLTAK